MTVFHQEALHEIQETASIVMNFSYVLAFVHGNLATGFLGPAETLGIMHGITLAQRDAPAEEQCRSRNGDRNTGTESHI